MALLSETGFTEVDFGSSSDEVEVFVSVPEIPGDAYVEAWIYPRQTVDHEEVDYLYEDLHAMAYNVVANSGFTINAQCRTGLTFGKWVVSWVWTSPVEPII